MPDPYLQNKGKTMLKRVKINLTSPESGWSSNTQITGPAILIVPCQFLPKLLPLSIW